jgi:predicted RNA-binding Zn ribbon-like protein
MSAPTAETIVLRGGSLCLDFANSADWASAAGEPAPEPDDVLATQAELVRWGARAGVLTAGAPVVEPTELERGRELRATLHRVFSAAAAGAQPLPADLATLQSSYRAAAAAATIAARDGAWRLHWPADDGRSVRHAVAADAVALLGDPARLARVKRCPGRSCGWLFLDTSGRRRWCSMDTCGSREKMRRLYQRRSGA